MDLCFDELMNAKDELELIPLVKQAVGSRGAESFVFASLHPTGGSAGIREIFAKMALSR
ncbi:hypothetical protein [Burkholderia singularis]|uniref:hypothetical protein n=1 Tax=Burkholderia singularis TaxID=1503053 RepID=UPI000AD50ECD|nr:hypothetical protein [Burkholderia singularis]